MKRLLIILILILIALLFLYAAHLDGVLHISAFALNKCEFCEFLEEYDLDGEIEKFPKSITATSKGISYELALYAHMVHGHDRIARHILQYNVPFNYCPECGRRVRWDRILNKG